MLLALQTLRVMGLKCVKFPFACKILHLWCLAELLHFNIKRNDWLNDTSYKQAQTAAVNAESGTEWMNECKENMKWKNLHKQQMRENAFFCNWCHFCILHGIKIKLFRLYLHLGVCKYLCCLWLPGRKARMLTIWIV